MRKFMMIMIALLIACMPAMAETDFILPFADAIPVTNHTALVGISAVARGRTIVVRVSDEWMEAQSMNAPFGFSTFTCANETEERIRLTKLFSDDERESFLKFSEAFSYNEENVYHADINDVDNDLICMNSRRMDGCWYVVIRPEEKFKNSYSVKMNILNTSVRMQYDQLSTATEGETQTSAYQLNIQSANDSKAIFDKSGGKLRMVVFNELGANIAVIYKKGADSAEAEYARLTIEGLDQIIELSGYRDGSNAVYCCVLSDGELQALENGASIALTHDKYAA